MRIEPEFALFVGAGVLTVLVVVAVGVLVRHAFREERAQRERERQARATQRDGERAA
jgi:heme exporter protein D